MLKGASAICLPAVRTLPQSRRLAATGKRCHELSIVDEESAWRIMCRLDADAVVIPEVFNKKTQAIPKFVIEACKRRLREYAAIVGKKE